MPGVGRHHEATTHSTADPGALHEASHALLADRDAVAPPKTLGAATDEFEAVYADACRG